MIGSASVPFSAVLTSCCSDAGSIRRVIASPVFYFGPADLYFGGGAIRRTSAREAGRTRDFNRLVPANRQFPPGQADAPPSQLCASSSANWSVERALADVQVNS